MSSRLGSAAKRRLAGAGKTKEECDHTICPTLAETVHRHHALCGQIEIEVEKTDFFISPPID